MDLTSILNNDFFHHYQPIYDIQHWTIFGFEGLFRTEQLINPETTFNWARKRNRLYELDSISSYKALLAFKNAGYQSRQLFLNVYPSTISNPLFLSTIQHLIEEENLSSQRIIFEINESELVDRDCLRESVHHFRELGCQIAIDDMGKGYSSVRTVLELNPDYIKLDRYYIEELHKSEQKKYFINFLLEYCEKYSSNLIVEGVEENITLALLKSMGIKYAQGYLLGRPTLL